MSVLDHPVSFYQHNDITDPTPYEEDNMIFVNDWCRLCGRDFSRGQKVIEIYGANRELIHEDCYNSLFRSIEERTRFEEIMDRLGYEISEAEEEEE